MGPTDRVIVLIDMDCFYCQVEEKLNPKLKDKPIAVVQYNAWRGGGIIAVNYPARDQGVTRHMRGYDAKKKCPSINLVQVPEVRGKADLTKYRDAGKEVADVLATFTPLLERASVDEAYLDITQLVKEKIETNSYDLSVDNLKNTFVVEYDLEEYLHNGVKEFGEDNLKLAIGGLITEEIRQAVYEKTGYKCSAGIAHNKILAKLVCSLHKPNKQTILPSDAVDKFFETMPIKKIKSLGGKFGQALSEDLHITYMGQLKKFTEKELAQKYDEKTANWLYNISRGIDLEPVTTKLVSKSIACCKNFQGKTALVTADSVQHWLNELAEELSERLVKDLKENNRKAKQIVVSFAQEVNKKEVSSSRTHPLVSYDKRKIGRSAFEVIKRFCLKADGSYHIKFLGLSASHFEDVKKVREITSFFKTGDSNVFNKVKNNAIGNDKTGEIFDPATQQLSENVDESLLYDSFSSIKNEENLIQEPVRPLMGNFNTDENFDPANYEDQKDVYLQITQEISENVDELLFYDDSCRIKKENSTQEPVTPSTSMECVDEEIVENSSVNSESSPILPLSSFFKQYFNQEKECHKSTEQSDTIHATDEINNEMDEDSVVCSECNKRILQSEYLSHQDYHFALKLTENNTTNTQTPRPSINKSPNKKRKAPKSPKKKITNNKSVLSFFNTSIEDSSELTETCPECNKKLKISEVNSHKDYHVAKKIHLELNSAGSVQMNNKPKSTTKNKNLKAAGSAQSKSKSKLSKNNQSVMTFFKRV